MRREVDDFYGRHYASSSPTSKMFKLSEAKEEVKKHSRTEMDVFVNSGGSLLLRCDCEVNKTTTIAVVRTITHHLVITLDSKSLQQQ